ncbi:MAG: hypothetical protein H7A23_00520 [Leptospiraceae bacterium]|nr:hypothetical protein [Leptospiraceae bacterium]MCP5493014.1 hypothetical protein [Leptospiraceae bacterium]
MKKSDIKIISTMIVLLLFAAGCKKSSDKKPKDRERTNTTETKEDNKKSQANSSKEVLDGSAFNRFFPKSKGDYEIVFSQEKKGFASANLKKKGKIIALLSITDTNNNPSARDKYKSASKTIKGYPAVEKGSKGLSILVNDRFQVSVTSKSPKLKSKSLEKWITRFKLKKLAKL